MVVIKRSFLIYLMFVLMAFFVPCCINAMEHSANPDEAKHLERYLIFLQQANEKLAGKEACEQGDVSEASDQQELANIKRGISDIDDQIARMQQMFQNQMRTFNEHFSSAQSDEERTILLQEKNDIEERYNQNMDRVREQKEVMIRAYVVRLKDKVAIEKAKLENEVLKRKMIADKKEAQRRLKQEKAGARRPANDKEKVIEYSSLPHVIEITEHRYVVYDSDPVKSEDSRKSKDTQVQYVYDSIGDKSLTYSAKQTDYGKDHYERPIKKEGIKKNNESEEEAEELAAYSLLVKTMNINPENEKDPSIVSGDDSHKAEAEKKISGVNKQMPYTTKKQDGKDKEQIAKGLAKQIIHVKKNYIVRPTEKYAVVLGDETTKPEQAYKESMHEPTVETKGFFASVVSCVSDIFEYLKQLFLKIFRR